MSPAFVQKWGLWLMVALAVLVRLPFMTIPGHDYDLGLLGEWGEGIYSGGLFTIYLNVPSCNYPPVYLVMLGISAHLWHLGVDRIFALKIFPVLCEVLIVAILGWVYRQEAFVVEARHVSPLHIHTPNSPSRVNTFFPYLVLLLLALNPGMMSTTALWGQTESIMTLPLLLALMAVQRGKIRWAWLLFLLALLTKFQSIVLAPLFFLLTLRRAGLRSLIENIVVGGVIFTLTLLPFVGGSGWDAAVRHYLSAWYPAPTTVNAFNLWYFLTPPLSGEILNHPHAAVLDALPYFGDIPYRYIGLVLVGIFALLICAAIWRHADEKREFLWAAALDMGFFVLATRIHERYLYPAVVFALIASLSDKRIFPLAIALSFTYFYNILYTLDDVSFVLPLRDILPPSLLVPVLVANVVLLVAFAGASFMQLRVGSKARASHHPPQSL